MAHLKKYFAASSVTFLIVLAIVPVKDYFREWKRYQYEYNDLIEKLPQRVKPADIGIKQLWVRNLDNIDRCVTCHLGMKEEALRETGQPFRTHPHIYHDIEDFGCTICHEGQGLSTTFRESVGRVKYWDRPIFPREFMEASCAKCHKEKLVPQAPVLTSGRKLIEESSCAGCHTIEGYRKRWIPGLDGIGSKVNRIWLVNWLKNPKAYSAGTKMPNFMLSDEESNLLADFLMTFNKFPGGAVFHPVPTQLAASSDAMREKLIELGSTRFREARCISCHPVNGKGGSGATDLGTVADKVDMQWLFNYVQNPKRLQPGVEMPRYRFDENELAGVVAYMLSEFTEGDREEDTSYARDPAFYEKGLALFKKYNCSGCHQLGGMLKAEEMAPELTSVGSKKIYEIDFGESAVGQSLPAYLFAKLQNPRSFSASMKMPSYEFSDEDAQAITTALLGNISDRLPGELIVRPAQVSTYQPQGEFGRLVDELACFGCHTMFGRGRLVATDLTLEASQTQRAWIEDYFKVPYSLRPILTERMPNLFLTEPEIRVLVDYMEQVCIADSLERDITIDQTKVAKGEILYFEKYGCQACHQIRQKGGYVGPPLDNLGSRLKASWIFHWLKNPRAFKPESIEPDNHLSDEEAEALTAYLMTVQ